MPFQVTAATRVMKVAVDKRSLERNARKVTSEIPRYRRSSLEAGGLQRSIYGNVALRSQPRTSSLAAGCGTASSDSLLFVNIRDLGAQNRGVIHRCLPDQRPMDAEVFMHQNIA
jgi:hypothetical protein